jgi:transcription initiation factor IIE alpha subunit
MNAQPSLFDHQPTIERRNASYHSLQPRTVRDELKTVVDALMDSGGLTSRQISEKTNIERTSVTRLLSDYKDRFDTTDSIFDERTNRTVTIYRIKGK